MRPRRRIIRAGRGFIGVRYEGGSGVSSEGEEQGVVFVVLRRERIVVDSISIPHCPYH